MFECRTALTQTCDSEPVTQSKARQLEPLQDSEVSCISREMSRSARTIGSKLLTQSKARGGEPPCNIFAARNPDSKLMTQSKARRRSYLRGFQLRHGAHIFHIARRAYPHLPAATTMPRPDVARLKA
jgi:hypothetical protein